MQHQATLASAAGILDTLSPLATLKRGYTITSDAKHNVIYSAKAVKANDQVSVRFADGEIVCDVVAAPI